METNTEQSKIRAPQPGRFTISMNGETFYGEFDTREEALAEAMDDPPGDKVYVGEIAPVMDALEIDGSSILEHLGEDAYEIVGEVADGWPMATQEQERDLGAVLTAALREWIESRGLTPTFFRVIEVEEHDVPPVGSEVPSNA